MRVYTLDGTGSLCEGINLRAFAKIMKFMSRGRKLYLEDVGNIAVIDVTSATHIEKSGREPDGLFRDIEDALFAKHKVVILYPGEGVRLMTGPGPINIVYEYAGKIHTPLDTSLPGPDPLLAMDPGSLSHRIETWLRSGKTGTSSRTICDHLFGQGRLLLPEDYSHPLDPSDLGRCINFLENVPEARTRLHELGTLSEQWAALIAHWATLEQLYHEELASGRAPRCYAMMKTLLDPLETKASPKDSAGCGSAGNVISTRTRPT